MNLKRIAVCAILLWVASCTIDPVPDPNNPSAGDITDNASLGEIQNLVTGIESGMRDALNFYYDDAGVIGREYYRLSASDPRFTQDLLGKEASTLDNNTFYTTNPWAARYRVVKNTNILIEALENTKAAISDEERKAAIAYSKTIQAYQILLNLNLQYSNGVRMDVADPDNLGPFLGKDESFAAIAQLLDEANTDLQGSSAALPFNSTIYGDDAATFSKFNRAIAARVAVYRKDWAGAIAALGNSFFSLTGDLNEGAYQIYSTGGGDQLNPLFFPLNSTGETRAAHESFITDIATNDSRKSKVSLRTSTVSLDGLSSNYDFYLYKTNVDRVSIIRNEELVLIYAEAKTQLSEFTDAVTAINRIRSAAGLANYSGASTQPALIDEMLTQRRFSLYGEGHRWIDLRRYDRLNTLPIDRPGDDVWVEFPRPAEEL